MNLLPRLSFAFGRRETVRVALCIVAFGCVVLTSGEGFAQAKQWRRVGTVTTQTAGQICYTNGTDIVCDSSAPTLSGSMVGIGSTLPVVSLDISQNPDAIALPGGSNAQRPTGAALVNGEIRYNNTGTGQVEAYYNGAWNSLVTSASVGTSTPAAGSTGYVQFNSGGYLGASSNFFWDNTHGRVGIGTTAPQSKLHIQSGEVQVGSSGASCASANAGAIRYSGGTLYYCDNASTWESIDSSGTSPTGDYYIATQTATATSGQGLFGGSSTLGGILTGYGSTADVTLQNRSGTAALEILANSTNVYMPGNVGIGTTAPVAGEEIQIGSAASTPGVKLSGNWYTGGTATTTKPQLLVEPAGTASTGWNTSGTGIGVNAASGFSGYLLDLQIGGSRQFGVSGSTVSVNNVTGVAQTTNTIHLGTQYEYMGFSVGSNGGWDNASLRSNYAGATPAFSLSADYAFAFTNQSGRADGTQDTFIIRQGAANLHLGAWDAAAPVAQTLGVQNVVGGTSNTAGANFTITGSQGTGTGAGGAIVFQTAPAGSTGSTQNALATAMTIASTGYVGIGTTAPVSLLTLGAPHGTAAPGFSILRALDNGASTYGFDLTLETSLTGDLSLRRILGGTATPVINFQRSTGSVGINNNGQFTIGANSPAYNAQVNGVGVTSSNPSDATLLLQSSDVATSSADLGGSLAFGGLYRTSGGSQAANGGTWARIRGPKLNNVDGDYSGYMAFDTRTTGSGFGERMRIDQVGNVGIGTTAPGSSLQVNGGAAIGYSTNTAAPSNGMLVSGQLGVGTSNPTSDVKADINGAAQIAGTGSETCATMADAGKMRFNPSKNYFEICSP